MRGLRLVLFLVPLVLLVLQGRSFELQDTIHALIEENIHLHDQLENLTQALRELKRMLLHHSHEQEHHHERHEHRAHHDEDVQHLWDEWSQHGISAETHLLLEHAFCEHQLHGSTAPLHDETTALMLLLPCITTLLLARCL